MLGNFPPFTTMQELNLDWILTKIKNILRFVPDDGAVGQILRRTPSGAEWSDEQGAGGSVTSVNGMQGAVVLTAADVGALPDSTTIPANTSDLNNDSGFITAAQAPVQSVNGQTGAVSLTIPDSTSDLINDSGFVDAAGAAAAAPVQSVNGQTGAVSLTIPDSTSDLVNDSGFVDSAGAAAAAPVQSVNGQTGAVVLNSVESGVMTAAVGTIAGNQVCVKCGNVVNIYGEISGSFSAQSVIAQLPAGYAPRIEQKVLCRFTYNGSLTISAVKVKTNGELEMYYGSSNISLAVFMGTFVI